LKDLIESDSQFALESLGMAIAFLEDALIAKKTISTGSYIKYEPESSKMKENLLEYMVLDS
jgi:hypothetical protein